METAGTCPGASAQKKAQEAWLQPGGASGRRDRENTWDSGRCESGKTGSLHWLSEKAGSHREKKESDYSLEDPI